MEQPEAGRPADPAADLPRIVRVHPPIWQELVIDLFFRPGRFFADQVTLWQTRYVVAVCWVYGMATAIDKFDEQILKAGLNPRRPNVAEILGPLTQSWTWYWTYVLAYGALCGLFLWWIGGWWYRIRLIWSGAVNADVRLARLVYIYASFVAAAPSVIYALIQTATSPNYNVASDAAGLGSVVLLLFPFWSLFTSYRGVRTLFEVSRWKARLWFVILPGLVYAFALAAFVVLLLLVPELQGAGQG